MKISICVPIHDMDNAAFFLRRLMQSLEIQTFTDYEIVITKEGRMAENTNAAIEKSRGELVKILYMDDFLFHKDALKEMVENFGQSSWMMAGADNNPSPVWTDDILTGNNKLGSPSALMMRKDRALYFDENLSWLLDVDLYSRLYKEHGPPRILEGRHIGIGVHPGQMTNILTDEEKLGEHHYLMQKHE